MVIIPKEGFHAMPHGVVGTRLGGFSSRVVVPYDSKVPTVPLLSRRPAERYSQSI